MQLPQPHMSGFLVQYCSKRSQCVTVTSGAERYDLRLTFSVTLLGSLLSRRTRFSNKVCISLLLTVQANEECVPQSP